MKTAILYPLFVALGWVLSTLSAAEVSPLTRFPALADGSSNPAECMVWNGKWVFSADSLEYGRELWSCDLDGGNLQLLYDAAPGSADGSPEELTLHRGELWFRAYDSNKNSMLCKMAPDGIAQQLARFVVGERGTEVRYLTPAGDRLFFKVYYRSGNYTELWMSDGASSTTKKVVDVARDDIGLETTLVPVGDKVLYLNHWVNLSNPTTSISDGTALGTKQFHSGERYEFTSYLTKDGFSYVAAIAASRGQFSIMRVSDDAAAPVSMGVVSLPTGNDWRIKLRGLHGNTLYFDVRVYRNFSWTYLLGRYQISDGTVEYFPAVEGNDVSNPNDISPDGFWYFVQPNETGVLKRMTPTGPVEVIQSYVNQSIQSVNAQTGSVVVSLQWYDIQANPTMPYEWSVRFLKFTANQVAESLWGAGRFDEGAARELRTYFEVGYDAVSDRYAVSIPSQNQGNELVLIKNGEEPQAVNLNRKQDQSSIYQHLLVGDRLFFARKNAQGDSELWRSDGSIPTELITTFPELPSARSLVFHPVESGLLVSWIDRLRNERMTYFSGSSGAGTEVTGLPATGANSHRAEKAIFQKGPHLLLKWETSENPIGLWSFDASTQTLTSLASRFAMPAGSLLRVSYRDDHHVYLYSQIQDGSGVWQENGYWRSDGTLSGTQQIAAFPTSAIAWKQKVIELDQGQIMFRDGALGPSQLLATLPESANRRELVDAREMNGFLYFGIMPASGGWLESVWQTDGTPAGTMTVNFYPFQLSAMQQGKRFLVANTDQGLFFYRGPDMPSHLVNATADGVVFDKIQQVIVSDLAVYFVATTPEHGEAIFVSHGTQASTFLLYDHVAGSGTRLPLLLEATSRQLIFRQADDNGAAQVYALTWPEHRISAEWDTWTESVPGLTFLENDQVLWVSVTRTPETNDELLEWRITGESADHFLIGSEIDDGWGNSGRLSRVPIRFRPQTVQAVDAMVEVFVRGTSEPLMRFRVEGQYSPAPLAMTINGRDPQSDDFYLYSMAGWGWNLTVSPTDFQKRGIATMEYFLNGKLLRQGREFTYRITPTESGMRQITVKGYDAAGQMILFVEQNVYADLALDQPPPAKRNYHTVLSYGVVYDPQMVGELHVYESRSGAFTLRFAYDGKVFRGKGTFNKSGLAQVKVRKNARTLTLLLERRYSYDDIPIIRAVLTDGKFSGGILQPKDLLIQFEALGNDRVERNEPHLAAGKYHSVFSEFEGESGTAGVMSIYVASDGTCRTMGTWLNGQRFTHAAHQPRRHPYLIFFVARRPTDAATMEVTISEDAGEQHHFWGWRIKKEMNNESLNFVSLLGVVERYDLAFAAGIMAEDISQKQWYWGRSAWAGEVEILLPMSEWSAQRFGYESRSPSVQALIDVNRGTARMRAIRPDAFTGTALYFPSMRKFIGAEEFRAKGRMWTLGPEE